MDYARINQHAQKYETQMVDFLRQMVAIPSESCEEGAVIDRIRQELETVGGYDRIRVDGLGNLIAELGSGPRIIAIDAHVDTVGVGDRDEWAHDPYTGKVEDGIVYGRGAGDQEGAIPSMVYAGRILRDLQLLPQECTLVCTFTVMEEDCDGLCWQYLVQEEGLRPEVVVVTDSTNMNVLRGQRGRMEIGVEIKGRSCHGSMPHKGDNAVYKMARLVSEIERLNAQLPDQPFLGKGTMAVSHIDCRTPSMCAVPDMARIHVDRRLSTGDTKESALEEIRQAAKRVGVPDARVWLKQYERPSYTGTVYPTECYFPTWLYDADTPHVQAAAEAYRRLFNREPTVDCWTFSTNAVSIAGLYGIPSVGFGPAEEAVAHTVNDRVPIEHLIQCAAYYAAFPGIYCETVPTALSAQTAEASA
ncbi:MAG: YgeY family selenium metabolism-linked hydrolase [Opitutales bacterium]